MSYQTGFGTGFGNHFATEAIAGALPVGRNSPQRPAFGLYAEQLSGTAFTVPRAENRRSWLYRMRPAASHPPYTFGPAPAMGSDLRRIDCAGTRRRYRQMTRISSTA